MKTSRKLILVTIVHLIWSTLDDTCQYVPLTESHMPMLMGSDRVPHIDASGDAAAFLAGAVGGMKAIRTQLEQDEEAVG